MFFNAAEMQPSNLDVLLNRLDAARARQARGVSAPPNASSEVNEAPPTITDFLDEDDLLPECRSDNGRLIEYLCKEEQIMVRWRGLVWRCASGARGGARCFFVSTHVYPIRAVCAHAGMQRARCTLARPQLPSEQFVGVHACPCMLHTFLGRLC